MIKVIRPNIKEQIDADLMLMQKVARLVAKLLKEAKRLRPIEVVNEYKKPCSMSLT